MVVLAAGADPTVGVARALFGGFCRRRGPYCGGGGAGAGAGAAAPADYVVDVVTVRDAAGRRTPKYKALLEEFVRDVLVLVGRPEWPAAHLVVERLGTLQPEAFASGEALRNSRAAYSRGRTTLAEAAHWTASGAELFDSFEESAS